MNEPHELRVGFGCAVVYSTKSPAEDRPNQDALAVLGYGGDSGIMVVADGVGGARLGGQAARIAVESLARALREGLEEEAPLRAAVLNGIERANAEIGALGTGAATTVSVVQIEGGSARPYHVGDSEILIVGQRGRRKLQIVPHGPVGYALEAGLLDASEALHHEERHLVSNLVGSADMRIEVGPAIKLARHDTVVIGTDGLFDNLYLDEIVELVRKGRVGRAAEALAATCHRRMKDPAGRKPSKPDDLTFILCRPQTARSQG